MLLRRSSSPILKYFISVSADTSPGSANHLHLSPTSPTSRSSTTLMTRATSDSNISGLLAPSIPKRKERAMIVEDDDEGEEEEKSSTVNRSSSSSFGRQHVRLLSISGLDHVQAPASLGGCSDGHTLVNLDEGCVGDGGSGGRICGGGGGGSGSGFSDSNKSIDVYYQEMIQANPSDPLILGNYSKYLKEVQGDLDKAEEYCERAILANQREDGGVLSMYAEIIWERSKDAERAEAYFDRAVQAAPEDCYVLASYSRFLWDAEEEEEEEAGGNETRKGCETITSRPASWTQPSPFFPGQATSTTTAAAS